MEKGIVEFSKRSEPPFIWYSARWLGGNFCRVGIDFISEYGNHRILPPGKYIRLRQFRLMIIGVYPERDLYECVRISGKNYEFIMNLACLIWEIVYSIFHSNYWIRRDSRGNGQSH